MPAPHKKSPSAGRILLIEEYPALASAFGSAVRKFAGERETLVAPSLAEAKSAVDSQKPDLLILDFDPPLRGCVEFFYHLRSELPAARMLILVPAKPPDFSEQRPSSAMHFLEKPFPLAEFGAQIARLLQPDDSAGRMRDFGLIDLITLYALSATNMVLKVKAAGTRNGEIHFSDGRITHAAVVGRTGVEALHSIMRWQAPHFTEAERPSDAAHSINVPWVPIVAEGLRSAPAPTSAKIRAPAKPDPAIRRKKIVVIEDTELISDFVREILTAAETNFDLTIAPTGLEGLSRVSEVGPDLVLLDYNLPDLKGDEVARRLLENPETAALPIIMMSGNMSEMTRTAAQFSNVVATIPKPFLSNDLLELVSSTLAPLSTRAPKKSALESHVEEAKKSKNGKRAAPKIISPEIPAPRKAPESITEVFSPSPEPEAEVEIELEKSFTPAPSAAGIPVAIKEATSNVVVLGFALEVMSIEFSTELRIQKIRARPFSAAVSMRVLPQANARTLINNTGFDLAAVDLDQSARMEQVRLIPAQAARARPTRYPMAIDGVSISAASNGQAVELLPTAVAPMRLQLLSLFELSSVELSPEFRVANLLLKARGAKTRITLLPEMPHTGATFDIAEVRINPQETIGEIVLEAAPA